MSRSVGPWPGDTHLCGVCGCPIGPFRVLRGPVTVNVWRHTGDTSGLLPHNAILGAPGRRATIEEMTEALGDPKAAADLWSMLYGRDAKPKKNHRHLEEIPTPRVPARPATEEEIPAGAKSLRNLAVEHDWDVRVIYAIGPFIAADGYGVVREVESVSVRCRRGGQRVVSIWERAWTPGDGPTMVTKRTKCVGCKSLTCDGCELGPGGTEELVEATWAHDGSWLVTPATVGVKLSDVRDAIKTPEAYCEGCGNVLGNHIADPKAGYVCPVVPEQGVA